MRPLASFPHPTKLLHVQHLHRPHESSWFHLQSRSGTMCQPSCSHRCSDLLCVQCMTLTCLLLQRLPVPLHQHELLTADGAQASTSSTATATTAAAAECVCPAAVAVAASAVCLLVMGTAWAGTSTGALNTAARVGLTACGLQLDRLSHVCEVRSMRYKETGQLLCVLPPENIPHSTGCTRPARQQKITFCLKLSKSACSTVRLVSPAEYKRCASRSSCPYLGWQHSGSMARHRCKLATLTLHSATHGEGKQQATCNTSSLYSFIHAVSCRWLTLHALQHPR